MPSQPWPLHYGGWKYRALPDVIRNIWIYLLLKVGSGSTLLLFTQN